MRLTQTLSTLALSIAAILIATGCGGGSTSTTGGGGGVTPTTTPNYTTCNSQQVPNWRATTFQSNYQAALSQLITHYESNASIGYIRVGLGRGGEINLPTGWNDSTSGACYTAYTTTWGYTAGPDATYTWDAYLQSNLQYESTLASPKTLLVSITPVAGATSALDDFVASTATAGNISFGSQGLQASDITNYPNCGGDWCNLFAKYPKTTVRELQTLDQSCPTGTTCASTLSTETGPLVPLITFGLAHNANDFELYYQDWLIAFDPTYAASAGATASAATYQSTIQNAVSTTGVTVQLLFPPLPASPDYAAVQQYLLTNPTVHGVVINVPWSDFDLGNTAAGTHTSYSFTITDALIQPWIAAGKTVNLVLQNTSYGSTSCPVTGSGSNGTVGSNCAMPGWMWTALSK
jgi:hypothetical protein